MCKDVVMELFLARKYVICAKFDQRVSFYRCLRSGLVEHKVIYKSYGWKLKNETKPKSFSGEIVRKRVVENSFGKEERTEIHHHNHHQTATILAE